MIELQIRSTLRPLNVKATALLYALPLTFALIAFDSVDGEEAGFAGGNPPPATRPATLSEESLLLIMASIAGLEQAHAERRIDICKDELLAIEHDDSNVFLHLRRLVKTDKDGTVTWDTTILRLPSVHTWQKWENAIDIQRITASICSTKDLPENRQVARWGISGVVLAYNGTARALADGCYLPALPVSIWDRGDAWEFETKCLVNHMVRRVTITKDLSTTRFIEGSAYPP